MFPNDSGQNNWYINSVLHTYLLQPEFNTLFTNMYSAGILEKIQNHSDPTLKYVMKLIRAGLKSWMADEESPQLEKVRSALNSLRDILGKPIFTPD